MKKFLVSAFVTFSLCMVPVFAGPVIWVGDTDGNLGTVDIASGNFQMIGDMGHVMTDIAFDPQGKLYGITSNSLYSINPETANASLIGDLAQNLDPEISWFWNSLVFDSAGNLFAANYALWSVSVTTGAASLIGNGDVPYNSSGDLAFVNGSLYLTSVPPAGSNGDNLVLLDPSTGKADLVGPIGYAKVYGLASPDNIHLYGIAGTQVLSINTATGAGQLLKTYSEGYDANGAAFYSESGAQVPEPQSLLLIGAGLGVMGLAIRRRI